MTENSIRNDGNLMFPGKIAVITSDPVINEDDYHSVDYLVAKYGTNKILHLIWPMINFMPDQKQIISIIAELAADREIKALIFNQTLPGGNAAVDKLKESRDDIFIVFCHIHESVAESVMRANLLLRANELAVGPAMVKQAKKQGAKVFVHYTFPRHMAMLILARRRNLIKETCTVEGIHFVDADVPDPTGEIGLTVAQEYIFADVSRMVDKHGKDTAFFCTNCSLQTPLIKAVVENHAIYPQQCCPSPYHGFPEALGIDLDKSHSDLHYLLHEASSIAAQKNMTDRLSTWPVSASMMSVTAGAEYAIRWINGQVPKTGIDDDVLKNCMNAYIESSIGEEGCVFMNSYSEEEVTYHNYKQILMSYLDF